MDKNLEFRITGEEADLAKAREVIEALSERWNYTLEIREPKLETSQPITLDNLIIEEKGPRQDSDPAKDKILQTYDQSLQALKQRGYERHLRPEEAFKILISSLEDPNSQFKNLAKDMLSSYGEWLSLAFLRQADKLTCYLDPENITWNGTIYEVKGKLKHAGEKTFDIGKISSQSWIDLNKFPPDLVEFLYSRQFDKLPEIMQKGPKRSQLWLPREGIIRPCSRGYFYSFDVDSYYDSRASRGVRFERH